MLLKKEKASCWLQTGQASSAGLPGCSRLRGNWFCFSPFMSGTLCSCPASCPVPQFAMGPPVLFAQPKPLVHQLRCPLGALIRGNSHPLFLIFAVLHARDTQSPFRLVQLPHCVKAFRRLLTP